MQPVAAAHRPYHPTHNHFRPRVAAFNAAHQSTSPFGRLQIHSLYGQVKRKITNVSDTLPVNEIVKQFKLIDPAGFTGGLD